MVDDDGRDFVGRSYRDRFAKSMNEDLEDEKDIERDLDGIPREKVEEPKPLKEKRNQTRKDMNRAKLLRDLIVEGRYTDKIYPFPEHPTLCDLSLTIRSLEIQDRRCILVSPRLDRAKELNNKLLLSLDLMIEELAWAIIQINGIDVDPPRVAAELRALNKEIVEYLYSECVDKVNAEINESIAHSLKAKGLLGN